MVYPRFMKPILRRDLRTVPVVVLMGARQVGKTTLCRDLAAEMGFGYRTLDDRDTLAMAQEDPEGLVAEAGDSGLAIDEVQRAPGLLLTIKSVVDREQRAGRYLLSGSNQPAVAGAVAESLQGRAIYRTLRPLTLGEQRYDEAHPGWGFLFGQDVRRVVEEMDRRAATSGTLEWSSVVATGGFPRALSAAPPDRRVLLNGYVETFTRRDIREVLGVESVERFEQFFRLIAARTAQELNFADLSRELGTPVQTLRRWADATRRSYLIERIPAWSRNASSRVTKGPKLFMADSALAMAAARETSATGFHLETLVATDILAWQDQSPDRAVYHWRIASGPEVDFVLAEGSTLVPVEVKAAARVTPSDTRHLRRFLGEYEAAELGVLLSNDPEVRQLGDHIVAGPWWSVL